MEPTEVDLTRLVDTPGPSLARQIAALRKRMGEAAYLEAVTLAKQTAEATQADYDRTLAGALWLAQFVGDFRDVDTTRLSRCPVCEDKGWQLEETERGNSGARPCRACDLGLALDAGSWLDRIYPFARGGKRFKSDRGLAAFEESHRHFPTRRDRLIARIEELKGGSSRASKQPEGAWD